MENKKHIAILFPPSSSGGVYQYTLSIAQSLFSYCDKFRYSVIYFEGESEPEFFNIDKNAVNYISVEKNNFSSLRKIIHFIGLALNLKFLVIKDFNKSLKKYNIDLLIISTPFSYHIPIDIPYICSVPDYMHKYYPEFSEYGIKDRLSRDIVYTYYAKNSVLVAGDSFQQISDLEKFAKIKKEKVRVIYYIPPNYVYYHKDMSFDEANQILSKYNLPEKFIFFPGQFWAQKNHKRLIEALHLIEEKNNIKVNLVLVGHGEGSYEKTYKDVMALADELKIKDRIFHLGYVSNKEMVALYKKAIALVAPPFQGPTTIPPLEAIVLGAPVATINLFEVPNQVGQAALLFNPSDVNDMADKIYKLWTDENLRSQMKEKAREKAREMTLEKYAGRWEKIIADANMLIHTK